MGKGPEEQWGPVLWGQHQAVMEPRTLSEAGESWGGGGGGGSGVPGPAGERGAHPLVCPASLTQPQEEEWRRRGSGREEVPRGCRHRESNRLLFHFWTQARHKTEQTQTVYGSPAPTPLSAARGADCGEAWPLAGADRGGQRSAREGLCGAAALEERRGEERQTRSQHRRGLWFGAVTAHGQRTGTEGPGPWRPLAQGSA